MFLNGTFPRTLLAGVCALVAGPAFAQMDTLEPAFAPDVVLTKVLDGFLNATSARFLPDGRMVIADQIGDVYVWTGTGTPSLAGHLPVAPTLGETGLLGMAVDPEFVTSNRLYFMYSAVDSSIARDRHRVAWAVLDPATNQLGPATEILHNLLGSGNHNGGGIEFGPDGLIYVGAGDKGCSCGCEPGENTANFFPTCLTNMAGKILRIGRDGEIPPSNPLVGSSSVTACGASVSCTGAAMPPAPGVVGPPREEIYLWGFRQPWRFSFDSQTGYLWIGDVGEHRWEEVTVSKRGGEHHGWPYREGLHGQPIATCQAATPETVGPCVDPVYEYTHDEVPNRTAGSVTGGVFSNHCSWPAPYRGRYWFSDYTKHRIWMLEVNAARDGVVGDRVIVVDRVAGTSHMFTGNDGAIYYVSIDDGEIWRIAPAHPAECAMDAGVMDAGPGPMDTGVADTGTIAADPDAAVSPPDPDAGAPVEDRDADTSDPPNPPPPPPPPPAQSSGCGCTATEARGAAGALLWFAALVWVTSRRRRGMSR